MFYALKELVEGPLLIVNGTLENGDKTLEEMARSKVLEQHQATSAIHDELRLALVDSWFRNNWERLTAVQPNLDQTGLSFVSPNPKENSTINYHPKRGFSDLAGRFRNYAQMVEYLNVIHECRANDLFSVFARVNRVENPVIMEATAFMRMIIRDNGSIMESNLSLLGGYRRIDEERKPVETSPKPAITESLRLGKKVSALVGNETWADLHP